MTKKIKEGMMRMLYMQSIALAMARHLNSLP